MGKSANERHVTWGLQSTKSIVGKFSPIPYKFLEQATNSIGKDEKKSRRNCQKHGISKEY
jgi:hypothetical protein